MSARRCPCHVVRGRCVAAQDAADRGLADPVAESGEFAVDSPVSPSWVFSCELEHQFADLVAGRWTSGSVGISPFACGEVAVPGKQCGWGDEAVGADLAW
jgi:hypothetical protein